MVRRRPEKHALARRLVDRPVAHHLIRAAVDSVRASRQLGHARPSITIGGRYDLSQRSGASRSSSHAAARQSPCAARSIEATSDDSIVSGTTSALDAISIDVSAEPPILARASARCVVLFEAPTRAAIASTG